MENLYLKHLQELCRTHNISLSEAALKGGSLEGKKELEGGGLLSSLLGIFGLYQASPMLERNYYENKDAASTFVLDRNNIFNSVDNPNTLGIGATRFNTEVARTNIRNAMTNFEPPSFSEITPEYIPPPPELTPENNNEIIDYLKLLVYQASVVGLGAAIFYIDILLKKVAKLNEKIENDRLQKNIDDDLIRRLHLGNADTLRLAAENVVLRNRLMFQANNNNMMVNPGGNRGEPNVVVQLQRGVPVQLPEFLKRQLLQILIDKKESCSICLDEFSAERGLEYCRCGHYYCLNGNKERNPDLPKPCIDVVLERRQCAQCRADV